MKRKDLFAPDITIGYSELYGPFDHSEMRLGSEVLRSVASILDIFNSCCKASFFSSDVKIWRIKSSAYEWIEQLVVERISLIDRSRRVSYRIKPCVPPLFRSSRPSMYSRNGAASKETEDEITEGTSMKAA